jgi:pSer/pThr/pTyr-binding forkhead associated (FHA) protein
MVRNLSKTNSTLLNNTNLTRAVHLHDGDIITIVDRSFRFVTDRPMPTQRTPLVERHANSSQVTPKSKDKPASVDAVENDKVCEIFTFLLSSLNNNKQTL